MKPFTFTESGVSARIREVSKPKKVGGRRVDYVAYVVDYNLLGKRKQEWRATLADAKAAASEACTKIANGEQLALELKNGDRVTYLRAVEAVAPFNIPIDTACRQLAELLGILGGKATPAEACREWVKRHAIALPKITVTDAVEELKKSSKADGKSKRRLQQLAAVLDRFVESFNVDVDTLTPKLMADYLTKMDLKERTKRNHRDALGYFNRWLVLRGYLSKGTDLMEGVQNYTARKVGEITTYAADELVKLINAAEEKFLPFVVIGAFAGLRTEEIGRLDWADIDLEENFIEIKATTAKQHGGESLRRIVPIKDNLKSWLLPLAKRSGKVVPFANITKQQLKTAKAAGVAWKHNALRHTCISARVAECADLPRVADESGNSVQMIRTHYLKRMRPKQATAWFSISAALPEGKILNAG